MDGDLELLRKEYADLGARATRFAIVTLIILAISCLTVSRAFRAIDQDEIAKTVDEIKTLAQKTKQPADLPWFINSEPPPETAVVTDDPLALQKALQKKLREDVAGWLTIEVALGAAKFPLNLQYWSFAIPIVFWGNLLFLMIYKAKAEAMRRLAAVVVANDRSASTVDRLLFNAAGPTPFAAYPMRIGIIAYAVAVVALMLNLFVAVVGIPSLTFLAIDSFRWMLVITFYVVMIGRYYERRILAAAAEILPAAAIERAPRFARVRALGGRIRDAVRRRWQATSIGGSALMLVTLFVVTASAKSCDGGNKKGADLLLDRDAQWPIYEKYLTLPGSFHLLQIGRLGYVLAIVAAIVGLVYVLLVTIAAPKRRHWIGAIPRGLAVTSFFFVVCELGFVVSFMGFADLNPPFFELTYWIVPSLLYWLTTVIGPKRWRRVWDERLRAAVKVLYLPAIITAPLPIITCVTELPGIPLLVCGTTLLAAAMVLEPAAVPVEAAAPLPAVAETAPAP
jgi:hypothetical protein